MAAPFIVFEGLDGAGTTTQAQRLCAALADLGHQTHFTREPSDGPVGQMIRQALAGRLVQPGGGRIAPETLALLFAADRIDHLRAEIEPLQARGVTVICDRYLLSSLAYQGQELDAGFVEAINARAPAPDLTLFVEVTPELALERRRSRQLAPELFEAQETQRRVAEAYQRAVAAFGPAHRVVRIDGSRGIEEVAQACLAAVRPLLGS